MTNEVSKNCDERELLSEELLMIHVEALMIDVEASERAMSEILSRKEAGRQTKSKRKVCRNGDSRRSLKSPKFCAFFARSPSRPRNCVRRHYS